MSTLGKVAVMLGISLSSFMAIAQKSPEKAIDTIKQKASTLTPEQLKDIENSTGIKFTDAGANNLFKYSPYEAPEKLPDVDLGKYGDINAVKVARKERDDEGKAIYTIQVNKNYSSDYNFNIIRSYVGKQNKNLKNAIIKFVNYKGSPFASADIQYK